jgi:GT2 family glycosyltransferase
MDELPDARPLAVEIRRRLGPAPERPEWPLVSIVVLNRDGADLLRRLLAGLVERTDYPDLELILVDNASSDDSLAYARAVEAPFPVSILANAHNESFSDACNQGAELAAGELLLFLNNDAEPFEPGWLRELVACLLGSGAAAVGPTLIQPAQDAAAPGRYLVHQRGLRARDVGGALVPAYRDHLADPLGEGLGKDVETVAIAAACLLIGREAFEWVGGFTHGYWYGPEDVDLALKLRERGMSARCCGRSLLVHPPNSTLDAIASEQRGEWVRGNRRLFAERWGPRLRREFELDRLRGGGLWAEPDGVSPPGPGRVEIEALGFCLKAAPGEDGTAAAASLDGLAAALRRRGRRCLILRGDEIENPAGLDYDVAVHLRGPWRYAPKPAQLNVLWNLGELAALSAIECSRYDTVLAGDADGSPEANERFAERLIEASAACAAARGFRTRVAPAE